MSELTPITHKEMVMAGEDVEPITREEKIMCGEDILPITRAEIFLKLMTEKSNVDVEPLAVTENGTYTAPKGKAYSPVSVNVPQGIQPTGTKQITENGTYDVTEFASAEVNVSSGGGGGLDIIYEHEYDFPAEESTSNTVRDTIYLPSDVMEGAKGKVVQINIFRKRPLLSQKNTFWGTTNRFYIRRYTTNSPVTGVTRGIMKINNSGDEFNFIPTSFSQNSGYYAELSYSTENGYYIKIYSKYDSAASATIEAGKYKLVAYVVDDIVEPE